MTDSGGYDDGYSQCPCFWGREPGRFVQLWMHHVVSVSGLAVLDAGCGEGKNAAYLADKGASVLAIDISSLGLRNARRNWANNSVVWKHDDVRTMQFDSSRFDAVIMYGLVHCFRERYEVSSTIEKLQLATKPGGYHILCCFNDRQQSDFSLAHPGFGPCLLPHQFYVDQYHGWEVEFSSDEDLHEIHPHNNVPHTHSMTRILVRKTV